VVAGSAIGAALAGEADGGLGWIAEGSTAGAGVGAAAGAAAGTPAPAEGSACGKASGAIPAIAMASSAPQETNRSFDVFMGVILPSAASRVATEL
jgi:hypothetical protein